MLDLASLCPHPVTVRAIRQETHDVWTLEMDAPGDYPYQPGQYALVGIDGGRAVRAYTLSSSPGLSETLNITVRRIENGIGSGWLTRDVKPGDRLWLSDAQGEFTPGKAISGQYLFLAGGCGITPVISMTRWLLAHRASSSLVVLYHVHSLDDVIFDAEWRVLEQRYPRQLRFVRIPGDPQHKHATRLSVKQLEHHVPDIAERTVMSCGPEGYMALAGELALQMGVPAERFHHEAFCAAEVAAVNDEAPRCEIRLEPWGDKAQTPQGGNLLAALEEQQIPVAAACRTGVCGSCKVKVLDGVVTHGAQSTLGEEDRAEGYALACCCSVHSDVVIETA
jgi:NADH oxidoreductase Hcr